MDVNVQFNAKLPVKITKKRKWHVASCPLLDVHSQGETETKAKNNLREALTLFFISCFERGTLEDVLKQCGFKAARSPVAQIAKRSAKSSESYINIPIPFIVNQDNPPACHV